MRVSSDFKTTAEWEQQIGRQVKLARIAFNLDQVRLATVAGVSVASLSNLERGKGSSLKTIICVARALGRTDWLGSFAPEPPSSDNEEGTRSKVIPRVSPGRFLAIQRSITLNRDQSVDQ